MKAMAATWMALVLAATLGSAFAATPEPATPAASAPQWQEGKHYVTYQPLRPSSGSPGQVPVVEVFSYACPACNSFHDTADRLRAALPKNAPLSFVAASFRADEDWPVFQRAYYTAQSLGIADRTHDAMFDAVWKTQELATLDPRNGQLRAQMPTIEDVAKFYARVAGIKAADFVAASKSFDVDRRVREAEDYIHTHRVDHTPMIIVADRYQTDPRAAGGYDELVQLVKWLVAKASR
jgi:thiol:disulfide interchange protein DsbA